MSGNINFNFTPEQQIKYDNILLATKNEYPKFFLDPINEYRIRHIIANNVILGDEEFGKQMLNKEQVIIEE